MTRYLYGATGADAVIDPATNLLEASTTCEVYDAPSGGTHITDLEDASGNAITHIVTDSQGFFRFQGPDGHTDPLWIDTGFGFRIATKPVNPPAPSSTSVPDLSDPSDDTKVDPTRITTGSFIISAGDPTTGLLPSSGRAQQTAGKARTIKRVMVQLDGPALASDLVVTVGYRERDTGTVHTKTITMANGVDLRKDDSTMTWAIDKHDDLFVKWSGGAYAGVNLNVTFDAGDVAAPTAIAAPTHAPVLTVTGGVLTAAVTSPDVAYRMLLTTGISVETHLDLVEDSLTYDVSGVAAGAQVNVRLMNRDHAGPSASFSSYVYSETFDTDGTPPSTSIAFKAPTNTTNTAGTGIAPRVQVVSAKLHLDTGTVGSFAAGDTAWFWLIDQASPTNPLSKDDFELLFDFAFTTSGEFDIFFRADSGCITDINSTSALGSTRNRVQLALFTTGYKLSQKVSGTTTFLKGSSGTAVSWAGGNLSLGTTYRARLKPVGAQTQLRVWNPAGSEPGTWEFTDTAATLLTAGVIIGEGVGPSTANTQRDYTVDNLQLADA